MKCAHTILALLVALPLVVHAQKHPGSIRTVIGVDSNLKAGEMALRDGDHELAIKKLLAGLPNANSRHDTAIALNNLCAAYSLAAEFDISLDYCDQALGVNKNSWRAYQNRARSLIGKGDFAGAIEATKKGLDIAPQSPSLKEVLEIAERLNAKPHVIIETFEAKEADE